jgi:hypothetical protein
MPMNGGRIEKPRHGVMTATVKAGKVNDFFGIRNTGRALHPAGIALHDRFCVNARILGAMDSAVAEGPERSRMGMRCPWTAAEEPRIRT